ncbi:ABC transporter permease subunit [Crenobacter sp. SG2305]|uniref:ABC transporter permease n=1 Tax=Crenobacter oryzisoli TaxID=3056844 RepID=UPI0025AB253C|nr:ABC transporter permease subunit [Crenobacter sp. SG2305]MDN0084191.1 ABC transporter permease subunit [Crenobacter sp. SG2305]
MHFEWASTYGHVLLQGLLVTIELLLLSGFFGFLLALLVGFGRLSKQPVIAWLSLSFTNLIRGTPLLVQIYVLYYGVGSLFVGFPAVRDSFLWPYLREGFWYVVVALTLSVGGYVGEVIKGGLRGVPKGELEAARALGMSRLLMIRRIWLPRAIQILLPSLAGESVGLLKSTALASTVAVMDVLGAANLVRAQTFRTYEPLLVIAITYLVLALLIERVFRRLELRIPVRGAL